jgi:hypothetical protein
MSGLKEQTVADLQNVWEMLFGDIAEPGKAMI